MFALGDGSENRREYCDLASAVMLPLAASYGDPATVASLVIGAVTLLLVVATFRQGQLAHQSLARSIRPLLADAIEMGTEPAVEYVQFGAPGRDGVRVPPGSLYFDNAGGKLQVSVPFRNIGAGVAVITGATTTRVEGGSVVVTRKFVPVGELVRVNVSLVVGESDDPLATQWWAMEGFNVSVDYSDAEGAQPLTSRAEIRQYATHGPFIERIAVFRKGETQPFVVGSAST
jgi:hypothetical protein